jgi:hypothetical protein
MILKITSLNREDFTLMNILFNFLYTVNDIDTGGRLITVGKWMSDSVSDRI